MSKLPPKRPAVPASPSKVVYRQPRSSSNSQQRNSISGPFKIGDRVTSGGKTGTIAFIGPTKFAEGEWIGISLDEAVGKNDGSHGDTRYFETDPNHGLFCRADKVQHLSINGSAQRKSLDNQLRQSVIERASRIPSGTREDFSARGRLHIGDRVMISGTKFGTLQYVGRIHIEQGIWCGISLDGPLGKHDGKIDTKRYFHCPKNHGIFAPLRHVEKVQTDPRLSTLSTDSGSLNFDSTTDDLHLSRFSSSSDSLEDMPTPPAIPPMRQMSLAPVDTKPSLELVELREMIREKDESISKLEGQLKKTKLEDMLTTKFMEEMQENLKEMKTKYDTTENENFNLLREKCELKQRIEDLEVELTVPDDHAVLSPEEYHIYQKSKKLIQELEEQVKHHENDERRIEDYQSKLEHATKEIEAIRLELRRMEEENQILEEKNSNAMDYEQQIKDYQTEIDLLKQQLQDHLQNQSEEDEYTNAELNNVNEEKKQHVEELLATIAQLKEDYQEIQRELGELNQREIKAHKTFQQSELQIEELQTKLDKSERENADLCVIHTELAEKNQIQDENENDALQEAQLQFEEFKTQLDKSERENADLRATLAELTEKMRTQDENKSDAQQRVQSKFEEFKTQLDKSEREKADLRATVAELTEKMRTQDENETDALQEAQSQVEEFRTKLSESEQENADLRATLAELTEKIRTQDENESDALREAQLKFEEFKTLLGESERENTDLRAMLTQLTEKIRTQDETGNDALQEVQSQLVQSLLEIEQLRTKLTALEAEKITSENQLNQAMDILKANFEELQAKREIQVNETLQERDRELQQTQLELDNLKQEKIQSNEAIDSLTQELEALKAELQDRSRMENELEVHYQSQLGKQKQTLENQFHEHIQSLKHDHEKLLNEQKQQEKTLQAQYEQEFDEYQRNLELAIQQREEAQSELLQLQEEKSESEKSLHDQIEHLQTDLKSREEQFQKDKSKYDLQIKSLEERLKEYKSTLDQTEELYQQKENLIHENTKLKKEFEAFRNEHDPKEIEDLNQRIAELQKMHSDYIQRQAEKEKEDFNERQSRESFLKEKISEFEMRTALMKSEFMVEMENTKLDHDQEVLRLKGLLAQKAPTKGKH